ncbi:MAG TPA: hypothetical protein VNJ46_10065 [Gaiellaceae bacterium]|nr:hypothetical protein [Gaiellaceae bacterium]
MKRARTSMAIAAGVASLALVGLVPAAGAHIVVPTVTAQHAFIGDPLFGLDTSEGTLFGIRPDERTAMASTTKLMTLDVTLHAVADGVVYLNDQVSVDDFAASLEPPNSVMADDNDPGCMFDANGNAISLDQFGNAQPWQVGSACVTLEPGEVVSLETLIRGMMYPSGNDASWAIAYHVAKAYGEDTNGDKVIDGRDFVERMNQHAVEIGLADTHFTSANGWDDPPSSVNPNPAPEDLDHYTTARELAEIINHGLEAHPHFGEVIGFEGAYTDTSQGPNGTKTYSWNWGFPYPGWEGLKGGGTTNCNGPNQGCQAISAKRIGRRVVVAFMQGVFGEERAMFDYGFGTIFHPDERGASVGVGTAERHDLACHSSSRCLSAVLPTTGPIKLVSWGPDVDSSTIAKLDEEVLPRSESPPRGAGGGQGRSATWRLRTCRSGRSSSRLVRGRTSTSRGGRRTGSERSRSAPPESRPGRRSPWTCSPSTATCSSPRSPIRTARSF